MNRRPEWRGLVGLVLCVLTAAAPAQAPGALDWSDALRDVYVDGSLDPAARVLLCNTAPRVAVLSARLGHALILDEAGRTLGTLPKAEFRFAPDGASARTAAECPPARAGAYEEGPDGGFSLKIDGHSVSVTRHRGMVGEISPPQLWERLPVWRGLLEQYRPSAVAVAALRARPEKVKITVVMGTWCPDSKFHVPRLLKALEAAGNRRLEVQLFGIDRGRREPARLIKNRQITRVPTVIVERDGRELGRIIEAPAAKTVEDGVVAIMRGAYRLPQ